MPSLGIFHRNHREAAVKMDHLARAFGLGRILSAGIPTIITEARVSLCDFSLFSLKETQADQQEEGRSAHAAAGNHVGGGGPIHGYLHPAFWNGNGEKAVVAGGGR